MVIKTVQDLIDELQRLCVNLDAEIVLQDEFLRCHTRVDIMARTDPEAKVVLFSDGKKVENEK